MEKVELQFKTVSNGSYANTFNVMKKYQEAGLADKNSKIIFNNVEVPAGYYEVCEESFELYEALVSGNLEELRNSLPKEATPEEIFGIEASIVKTYKLLHDKELSSEYLDTLLSNDQQITTATKNKSIQ